MSATQKVAGFRFDLISDIEFDPPEYVVDELLETDTLASVFGAPASGKSFLAIELALCVATGKPFHGRRVKRGSVLYIAGEGRRGLRRRAQAWSKKRGVDLKGKPLLISRLAAQLLEPSSARDVTEEAYKLSKVHGEPALIIIDTVARNFGGGDENNTCDMGKFVAALDALKAKFDGCTVLLVHHTGHEDKGRGRGSSVLKGALDAEYQVSKKDGIIELTCTKMKDAEHPRAMSFKLEAVELEEGVSSAVLTPTEVKRKEKGLTDGLAFALDAFTRAANVSTFWEGPEFSGLPLLAWRDAFFAQHTGDNQAAKRQAFKRGREGLVASGHLRVESDVYFPESDMAKHAVGTLWRRG